LVPGTVHRDEVRALVERGAAQLVEVLPKDEYDEEHLPQAIHLPLRSLDATTADVLDRVRLVLVYCWDALCDMSPRAAWRLERLGFDVSDYAAGKVDWIAAGLPTVRQAPAPPRAIQAADPNPPICAPETPVSALPDASVLVVNDHSIVLGRVPAGARRGLHKTAEEIMDAGPTTVRAHEPLDELLARMTRRHVQEIVVTTPEGGLLGVVRRPSVVNDLPTGLGCPLVSKGPSIVTTVERDARSPSIASPVVASTARPGESTSCVRTQAGSGHDALKEGYQK
jgi:rhodanese-related sulfurtransferase